MVANMNRNGYHGYKRMEGPAQNRIITFHSCGAVAENDLGREISATVIFNSVLYIIPEGIG